MGVLTFGLLIPIYDLILNLTFTPITLIFVFSDKFYFKILKLKFFQPYNDGLTIKIEKFQFLVVPAIDLCVSPLVCAQIM